MSDLNNKTAKVEIRLTEAEKETFKKICRKKTYNYE